MRLSRWSVWEWSYVYLKEKHSGRSLLHQRLSFAGFAVPVRGWMRSCWEIIYLFSGFSPLPRRCRYCSLSLPSQSLSLLPPARPPPLFSSNFLAKGQQKRCFLHLPSSLASPAHVFVLFVIFAEWNDPVSHGSVLCLLLRWRGTLLSGQVRLPSSSTCGRWRLLSEFFSHESLSCHLSRLNIMVEQHACLKLQLDYFHSLFGCVSSLPFGYTQLIFGRMCFKMICSEILKQVFSVQYISLWKNVN